jgi:cystathionine beta-lyase/cystathionine gamma-synthase
MTTPGAEIRPEAFLVRLLRSDDSAVLDMLTPLLHTVAEHHVAKISSARHSFAVSSGMGALDVIFRLLKPGDEIIAGTLCQLQSPAICAQG